MIPKAALPIIIGLLLAVACSSSEETLAPATGSPTDSPRQATATAVSPTESGPSGTPDRTDPPPTQAAFTGPTATPELGELPDDPRELMMATLDQPLARVGQQMSVTGNKAFIPVLVDFLRFQTNSEGITSLASFIVRLKENVPEGEPVLFEEEHADWSWWMEWLGNHPEIGPPEGYPAWKGELFGIIDPAMGAFLYDRVPTAIRIEEIAWGGVRKDGIPDLRYAPVISAEQADYLEYDDRVFGVSINGEHRAYPLRILNRHEMANDILGGVPFALAY